MSASTSPIEALVNGAPELSGTGVNGHSQKEIDDDATTVPFTTDMVTRFKAIGTVKPRDWYAVDVAYAGAEMRKWAGVEYESAGGKQVGKMVKGLWDPRGWECLWVRFGLELVLDHSRCASRRGLTDDSLSTRRDFRASLDFHTSMFLREERRQKRLMRRKRFGRAKQQYGW